jgi:hypothetical protein
MTTEFMENLKELVVSGDIYGSWSKDGSHIELGFTDKANHVMRCFRARKLYGVCDMDLIGQVIRGMVLDQMAKNAEAMRVLRLREKRARHKKNKAEREAAAKAATPSTKNTKKSTKTRK